MPRNALSIQFLCATLSFSRSRSLLDIALCVYRFSFVLTLHSTSHALSEIVRYMKILLMEIFNKCALYVSDTSNLFFFNAHGKSSLALVLGNMCVKSTQTRAHSLARVRPICPFSPVISLIVVGFPSFSIHSFFCTYPFSLNHFILSFSFSFYARVCVCVGVSLLSTYAYTYQTCTYTPLIFPIINSMNFYHPIFDVFSSFASR